MLTGDIYAFFFTSLEVRYFYTTPHTRLSPNVSTTENMSAGLHEFSNNTVDRVLLTYAEAAENQAEDIVTGYLPR